MLQFCSPELATYKHFKNIFPLRNIIMKELCVDLIAFTMPIYWASSLTPFLLFSQPSTILTGIGEAA